MPVLVAEAIKATLLLVVASISVLILRRASAATRSFIWGAAVVGVLLLPLAGLLAPTWEVAVLPALPTTAASDSTLAGTPAIEPESMAPTATREEATGATSGEATAPTYREVTAANRGEATVPARRLSANRGSGASIGSAPEGAVRVREVETPAPSHPATSVPRSSRSRAEPALDRRALAAFAEPGPDIGAAASVATASDPPRLARIVAAVAMAGDVAMGIWAIGALLLMAHLIAGLSRVAWIGRRARPIGRGPLHTRFRRHAAALGLSDRVRLLESDLVAVPVAWHIVRPCVILPRAVREWTSSRQDVVLVHELEHVRRQDCRMQLVAHLVVALHWFNPLAWISVQQLRRERERACDDAVIGAGTKPSTYAGHLVEIAQSVRRAGPEPTFLVALARSTELGGRVRAILDPRTRRSSPEWRTVIMIASIGLLLILPIAGLHPVGAALAGPADEVAAQQDALSTPAPVNAGEIESPPETESRTPTARGATARPAAQRAEPSLDQLVQMRIHGVTPEFIEEMSALFGNVDVSELVQLRIHGATPAFAREMADVLGEELDIEDLVQMRIHGVNAEHAVGMREIFGDGLDMDDLVNARIHGISGDYARDVSAAVGRSIRFDDLRSMRIHGVRADTIRRMQELLDTELDVDEIVQMHIHGVNTNMIDELEELGFEDLDVDKLVQMRIHGVTPKLIRDLRAAGYEDLTVDELVNIKIHGMDRVMLRRGNQ